MVNEWRRAELDQIEGRHWGRVELEERYPAWRVWQGCGPTGEGPLRWWAMRQRVLTDAVNTLSAVSLHDLAKELYRVDTPEWVPGPRRHGRESV